MRPVVTRGRTVLAATALASIVIIFVLARGALVPFLIGIALAYILTPFVERLARRLPRWLALTIVLVTAILVIAIGLRLLVPALVAQITAFAERLPELQAEGAERLEAAGLWWNSLGLPAEVRATLEESLRDATTDVANTLRDAVVAVVVGVLRAVGFVLGLLVIPFWIFYVLRDRPKIARYLNTLGGERREDVRAILAIADRVLGGWVRAQLVLMLAVGLAVMIGTFVLGSLISPTVAQFAIALGVIAGLTEVFPVIGPIIGAVPAVIAALADDPINALWVILLYIAIQQLEAAILVPKIVGDALGLHPAVLIVALVVGASVGGLLGAVLAAPLLAFARSLYRYADARLRGVPPADALLASDPAFDEA
jgi:predicted PurR-regulated permease PerM